MVQKAYSMKMGNKASPFARKYKYRKTSATGKRKAKAKPGAKAKRVTRPNPPRLNGCEEGYLAAVTVPFTGAALGACVPHFPSRPSMKTTCKYQGIMTVADIANAVGFVTVAPCLANDIAAVYYTTGASFSGQQVDITQVTAVAAAALQGNQFSQTDLIPRYVSAVDEDFLDRPPSAKGRIVACALRIRYIGSELSAAGVTNVFVSPSHSNIQGEQFDDMAARPTCRRVPVSREWTTIVDSASDMYELEYPEPLLKMGGDGSSQGDISRNQYTLHACFPYSNGKMIQNTAGYFKQGAATLVAFVSGASPGAKYEFEYVQHMEFIGEDVSNRTINRTIPNSVDRVVSAKQNADGVGTGDRENLAVPTYEAYIRSAADTAETVTGKINNMTAAFESIERMMMATKGGVGAAMKLKSTFQSIVSEVSPYVYAHFLHKYFFSHLRGARGHGYNGNFQYLSK